MGQRLATGLLALCSIAGLAGQVHAEEVEVDLESRFEALEDACKEHDDGKDMAALREALDGLAKLHDHDAADADLKEDIAKVVGKVSKKRRHEQVALEALYVLGQLGTPECARYVKPYLRQRTDDDRSDLLRAAIDVAGQIPDSSLVKPLIKLVRKSKDYGIAGQAMRALGRYGSLTSRREKILEELIDTVKKDKPGRLPRNRGSGSDPHDPIMNNPRSVGATSRWQALSGEMVSALNELTGQSISSPVDWFDVYDDAKSDLGDLFIGDRAD